MLILPGGEKWEKGTNKEVKNLATNVFEQGKPIAAICAATTFLGQLGILDNLKHTSNDLNYLKKVAPAYNGASLYQNVLAARDENMITANGIAPIEFAKEVFRLIGLYDNDTLEKWYQLFKNGVWIDG